MPREAATERSNELSASKSKQSYQIQTHIARVTITKRRA
jgi:hypothetical protein